MDYLLKLLLILSLVFVSMLSGLVMVATLLGLLTTWFGSEMAIDVLAVITAIIGVSFLCIVLRYVH